jgi:long-chain acyl-CoA synthetase
VFEDCPAGGIGKIWTRSEQNTVGYWRQPEETTRALTSDGWLRTGDLGRLDEEGRIFLVDRVKDLIIGGGENVYPAEVQRPVTGQPTANRTSVRANGWPTRP